MNAFFLEELTDLPDAQQLAIAEICQTLQKFSLEAMLPKGLCQDLFPDDSAAETVIPFPDELSMQVWKLQRYYCSLNDFLDFHED